MRHSYLKLQALVTDELKSLQAPVIGVADGELRGLDAALFMAASERLVVEDMTSISFDAIRVGLCPSGGALFTSGEVLPASLGLVCLLSGAALPLSCAATRGVRAVVDLHALRDELLRAPPDATPPAQALTDERVASDRHVLSAVERVVGGSVRLRGSHTVPDSWPPLYPYCIHAQL